MNKKRYTLTYDWNQEIVVEIDHDVMTDEKLHEINNFWSDAKYRLLINNDNVLHAVLKMLAVKCLYISITELGAVKDAFDWDKGNGQEGWPKMDGSEGITLISVDDFEFDEDEVTITEGLCPSLRTRHEN